jgi:hypothetical protein
MDTPHSRPGRTILQGALPLTLLALFALRHYGYEAFPDAIAARMWNIHGALVMLALLAWVMSDVARLTNGALRQVALAVAAWWAVEELMVVGCNTWWIVSPWLKPAGDSACYPILHFDIGKIGTLVASGALAHLVHRNKV